MSTYEDRNTRQAVLRGIALTCPACGKGKLLSGYLKINDSCTECGQPLQKASVDDGPAYFTLLIVVAIIFPMFGVIYGFFEPEPIWVALSMMAFAIVLALVILPRVKGVFVGLQWAKRLHGF